MMTSGYGGLKMGLSGLGRGHKYSRLHELPGRKLCIAALDSIVEAGLAPVIRLPSPCSRCRFRNA